MEYRVIAQFVARRCHSTPFYNISEKSALKMGIKSSANPVLFKQGCDRFEMTRQRIIVTKRYDASTLAGHPGQDGIWNHRN